MSRYPNGIDDNTTLPPASGDDAISVNATITAVEAVEQELGITPGGAYADVRTRLDILETRINNPFAPAPNVLNPFFISGTGVAIQTGIGDPNIVLAVPPDKAGSLYLRQDGYVNLYVFSPDGYWHEVEGGGYAPQQSWLISNWYVDPINGNDNNSGQSILSPVKTVMGGIVTKWGTNSPILPQTTTIHLLSSQTTGQEAIILNPNMVGSGPSLFVIDGTLGMTQIGTTFSCGAVTHKVRGNPGTLLQVAGMPAGTTAGMLVQNVTRGCWAFIDVMVGSTATLTQPLDNTSLTTPNPLAVVSEIDTWTTGDQCKVFQLPILNLKSLQPVGGDASTIQSPGAWVMNIYVPDISGAPGNSALDVLPLGMGTIFASCRIDPFLYLLGENQDVECGCLNCWIPGGGVCYFSGFVGGAVCTINAAFGVHLYNLGSVDGDIIIHGALYCKGFYNILGFAYLDGVSAPQVAVTHGNVVILESDGSGSWATTSVWGPGTINLEQPNSSLYNQEGATWAATLLCGAVTMDGLSVGSAYVNGTLIDGVSITPTNLDEYGGLLNPQSGNRIVTSQNILGLGGLPPQVSVRFYGAKGDGVTDDSAAFQKGVNALAGTNTVLFVPAGTYKVGTPITVPSNSTILGAKNAVMLGAMTSGGLGNFANSVFIALGSYVGSQTTLAATPTLYSFTLSSNASFPVGSNIFVARGGLEGQTFTVRAVSGVGPFNVTVDDPIMISFQAADTLQQINNPTNIIIDGLIFTGTGDRAIELSATQDSIIRNCTVNATSGNFGSIAMSFDIGGRRNLIDNVVIDAGPSGNTQGGVALENNSYSVLRRCTVRKINASGAACGLYLPTPLACVMEDCKAIQCNRGAAIQDSDVNDKDGPVDTVINNLVCIGSTGDYGLLVSGGRGCKASNVVCNNSAIDGIVITVGSSQIPDPMQLSNITCLNNANNGVNLLAPASRVHITNLTTKNNTAAGLNLGAANTEVFVNGMLSEDDPQPWSTGAVANANLTITNARFRNVAYNGLWSPLPAATSGVVTLEDVVYEYVSGTGTKAIVDVDGASTFIFRNVRTVGTLTYGIYAGNSVACSIWLQGRVDLQSCTTQIVNIGGYVSQSTVAANGITAVNVAFPDIKATSEVILIASTAPPTAYVTAITPGTGFSFAANTGDTQIYSYFIR